MFELYLITFNCARNLVDPESLAPSLFDAHLPSSASVPDVVAISLQEAAPIAYSFLGGSYLTPYFDRVSATVKLAAKLRSDGTEQLDHVATRSLGMTALMIFAKPQFTERIQWMQSAGAGVGLWNMGNKGAVAMRMGVSCASPDDVLGITFTAAHLAPMEANVEARNRDWEKIVRNMVFLNNDTSGYSSSEELPLLSSVSDPPPENTGLFAPENHLFFAGDLNYRTSDNAPGPDAHQTYPQLALSESSEDQFARLLKKDQLIREMDANRTLHGLEELPITFPPTYKYTLRKVQRLGPHKRSTSDLNQKWGWAKHRYPSWCDRILFLPPPPSAPRLDGQKYIALPVQPTSDHRPVALFMRVHDAPLKVGIQGDVGARSPFPINPNWRVRRDTARRLEIVVGIFSYLALTKKGNAIVVAVGGVAFACWWMATWLQSR